MTIIDWMNQLLVHKKHWNDFTEDEQKKFSPFIINRWLSMDKEFIEIVNYFQKYSIGLLNSREVYRWYCDILPKGKRFNRYIKAKKKSKLDDWVIDLIKKYFTVSKSEAIEYSELMTKNELTNLLQLYGTDDKKIKKALK